MKTLLYTGHNDLYRPLSNITVPRMANYAERHGLDFTCYTEPLIDVPHGTYWTGVCGAMLAFKDGYERAIYLDVDQLVTNFDFDIGKHMTNLKHGFHVPRDWGSDAVDDSHSSACCIITHRECHYPLSKILELEEKWRDEPFPEQGPMRFVLNSLKDKGGVYVHPRKPFNSVPDQVSPGNIPDPWKPGDWCAHITMVPLDRRIEIAKEILSSL